MLKEPAPKYVLHSLSGTLEQTVDKLMQFSLPPGRMTKNSIKVTLLAAGMAIVFIILQVIISYVFKYDRTIDEDINGYGRVSISHIVTLTAGSLFLCGQVMNGVIADYKEAEKIPAALAMQVQRYTEDLLLGLGDHDGGALVVNKDEVHNPKGLDAGEVELVKLHLLFLMLNVFQAIIIGDTTGKLSHHYTAQYSHSSEMSYVTVSDMDRYAEYQTHTNRLHSLYERVCGNNPVAARAYDHYYDIQALCERVRVISRTKFLPLGYWLLCGILLLNILVLLCTSGLNTFTERILFPSLVFIFTFCILLIYEAENPFDYVNGACCVCLQPLFSCRARVLMRLQLSTMAGGTDGGGDKVRGDHEVATTSKQAAVVELIAPNKQLTTANTTESQPKTNILSRKHIRSSHSSSSGSSSEEKDAALLETVRDGVHLVDA